MMNIGARAVETTDDVRSILESRFIAFAELLDCVRVARAADDWELVERAGTALLDAPPAAPGVRCRPW